MTSFVACLNEQSAIASGANTTTNAGSGRSAVEPEGNQERRPNEKVGPYSSLRPSYTRSPDLFHPNPECPLYFHLKPEFSLPRLFSYDSRTPVYFQSIPEAHVIFTPSRNKNLGSSENKTENKKETLENQGFPKVVILWGFGDGQKSVLSPD